MTKILLVEDDKSLREIYSVRLLAEGYTLISSGDGEEALAAAIGEKPDLIVSDVMMPKISGFEMLDLLRSNDSTKNIPVIMLTALSSEQQRERGNRLGADRYLIKSQVGIEDIVRTVHEVLGDAAGPKSVGQLQESLAKATQAAEPRQVNNQPQSAAQTAPLTNASNIGSNTPNEPIDGNPSIVGTNFGVSQAMSADKPAVAASITPVDQTAPVDNSSEPASFQSAFNPPAATNPAQVANQPQPQLPDAPMNIPTRMVQQPGMPASYATATQSAQQMPGAAPAQPAQRFAATAQPAQTAQQAPTTTTPVTQPAPFTPTPQQASVAQVLSGNAQQLAQVNTPASPMAATGQNSQAFMVPTPGTQQGVNTQPTGTPAPASANQGTLSGSHMTIQPPAQSNGPRINIDDLLASADATSAPSPMFPN